MRYTEITEYFNDRFQIPPSPPKCVEKLALKPFFESNNKEAVIGNMTAHDSNVLTNLQHRLLDG